MTMSRRDLFGMFRRRPEAPEPAPIADTPAPTADTPAPFALEAFYSARTPGREIPRFAVSGASVGPTTRVGAGPAMATVSAPAAGPSTPREPQAIPAGLVPRVLTEACLATTTFCSVCSERCPVHGAIVILEHRPHIVAARCDGCGVCVQVCPAPILGLELVARDPAKVAP